MSEHQTCPECRNPECCGDCSLPAPSPRMDRCSACLHSVAYCQCKGFLYQTTPHKVHLCDGCNSHNVHCMCPRNHATDTLQGQLARVTAERDNVNEDNREIPHEIWTKNSKPGQIRCDRERCFNVFESDYDEFSGRRYGAWEHGGTYRCNNEARYQAEASGKNYCTKCMPPNVSTVVCLRCNTVHHWNSCCGSAAIAAFKANLKQERKQRRAQSL